MENTEQILFSIQNTVCPKIKKHLKKREMIKKHFAAVLFLE